MIGRVDVLRLALNGRSEEVFGLRQMPHAPPQLAAHE